VLKIFERLKYRSMHCRTTCSRDVDVDSIRRKLDVDVEDGKNQFAGKSYQED